MLSFPVIVALHSRRPVFSIPLPLLNPVLRLLFQVPYAVTPVFAILTKTAGVVGVCFPFWKTLRPRRREVAFLFKFFHTLAHSFALTKNSTRLFSNDSALFTQKHPRVGCPC